MNQICTLTLSCDDRPGLVATVASFLATRSGLDPVAVEAERVRDNALRQVGDQTARAAVIMPLMRSRSVKKGLFGTAAAALLVGLIARRR